MRTSQPKKSKKSRRKLFHSSENDDQELDNKRNKMKNAVNEVENKEERQRDVLYTSKSHEKFQCIDSAMSGIRFV